MRTDSQKTVNKKLSIGSAFAKIGLVQSHVDLPKSVNLFLTGRETRVADLLKQDEIKKAKLTAQKLCAEHPIATEQEVISATQARKKIISDAEKLAPELIGRFFLGDQYEKSELQTLHQVYYKVTA